MGDKRTFIIFSKHRRLQRLWQFFFTGWGLVMVAALVAGALFTRQLLWTPITAIDMKDIATNQFKMTDANFSGLDRDGNPFHIHAQVARQEYDQPDIVFMDTIRGNITRNVDGKPERNDVSANRGKYEIKLKRVTLSGNVKMKSSTGDVAMTDEMVIKL